MTVGGLFVSVFVCAREGGLQTGPFLSEEGRP